ncbi:site-specific integrase [Photobacterium leiognathi]|uniref:site-specific integrase n=1 Tax=Photobacterium leiognathi TaxID=553611 RepID=UPI0029814110|nr:site-specific integrase [Photobacterium leiognathi]
MIDNITTLPSMFVSIFANNILSKKKLGTQENILVSLRFFYVYYYKKYKKTFDFDFYQRKYNISTFIQDLDGFFNYLLSGQHLNDKENIISFGYMNSAITKANKITYGNHIRSIGRFLKYLNFRYMNVRYQDMSVIEAHEISKINDGHLADMLKTFNKIEVSQNKPAHRYKSLSEMQHIELNNMLIPSTPAFTEKETGEHFAEVINPQNPFNGAFSQYRNYIMHRLMYSYGLRVGEVLLASLDSVGETLPDSRGNTQFLLIVQNLPDDVIDPRRKPLSLKTSDSYRQIELTNDDFILLSIYIEQYRAPLFKEKGIEDHRILFIKDRGDLAPISYEGIRTIYKEKIDPAFISYYPHYRMQGKRNIDYMVTLTPHVGRHTWAYITLEFIYNEVLKENLIMARDYGIKARMNGELDVAVEKLRVLGGWSVNSKVPLMYAIRFLEMVSNESNKRRTKRADQYLAIPEVKLTKPEMNADIQKNYDVFGDNGYDYDSGFDEIFG